MMVKKIIVILSFSITIFDYLSLKFIVKLCMIKFDFYFIFNYLF